MGLRLDSVNNGVVHPSMRSISDYDEAFLVTSQRGSIPSSPINLLSLFFGSEPIDELIDESSTSPTHPKGLPMGWSMKYLENNSMLMNSGRLVTCLYAPNTWNIGPDISEKIMATPCHQMSLRRLITSASQVSPLNKLRRPARPNGLNLKSVL